MSSIVAIDPPSGSGVTRTSSTRCGGPASSICSEPNCPIDASRTSLSITSSTKTSTCRIPVTSAAALLRNTSCPSAPTTTTPNGNASKTFSVSSLSAGSSGSGTSSLSGNTTSPVFLRCQKTIAQPTTARTANRYTIREVVSQSPVMMGIPSVSSLGRGMPFLYLAAPLCSGSQPVTTYCTRSPMFTA